jgi:hypothetical protein
MEAIRILTALHKPMDRTVSIALWGREEEGLLGSKFYVQQYFAPRDTMKQTPEFAKLDAYFNDDSGSGRFRGISAIGNLLTKAIFEQWIAPVKDLSRSPRSSEPPPRRPASLAGQTPPPSVGSASTDTVSCRIRWSTPAVPTTPTWISTTLFRLVMLSRAQPSRRGSSTTPRHVRRCCLATRGPLRPPNSSRRVTGAIHSVKESMMHFVRSATVEAGGFPLAGRAVRRSRHE